MSKSKFHVGCGAFAIYAGTLTQQGTMWKDKSVVTNEAISAAAQFLLQNDQSFLFTNMCDGKRYRMSVVEVSEKQEGEEDAE